jgi:hypothetical protein
MQRVYSNENLTSLTIGRDRASVAITTDIVAHAVQRGVKLLPSFTNTMFYKQLKIRGRPPARYMQLDLTDPKQLALAILKTQSNK